MLSLIFTHELTAEQKKHILETNYDIQMSEEIEDEFDTMCNFSRGFYQDGKADGKLEEQANIIKKLLRQFDPRQISSLLEIPLDEVEKVKRSISQN